MSALIYHRFRNLLYDTVQIFNCVVLLGGLNWIKLIYLVVFKFWYNFWGFNEFWVMTLAWRCDDWSLSIPIAFVIGMPPCTLYGLITKTTLTALKGLYHYELILGRIFDHFFSIENNKFQSTVYTHRSSKVTMVLVCNINIVLQRCPCLTNNKIMPLLLYRFGIFRSR